MDIVRTVTFMFVELYKHPDQLKCIQDEDELDCFSGHGFRILEKIKVQHPIMNVLEEACNAVQAEYHMGTNLFLALVHGMLQECQQLTRKKDYPRVEIAACLQNMAEQLTIEIVGRPKMEFTKVRDGVWCDVARRTLDMKVDFNDIQVVQVLGCNESHSEVVSGIAVDIAPDEVARIQLHLKEIKSKFKNVAIFRGNIELDCDVERILMDLEVDGVFVIGEMDRRVQDICRSLDILVVTGILIDQMHLIAVVTNGEPVNHLLELRKPFLGAMVALVMRAGRHAKEDEIAYDATWYTNGCDRGSDRHVLRLVQVHNTPKGMMNSYQTTHACVFMCSPTRLHMEHMIDSYWECLYSNQCDTMLCRNVVHAAWIKHLRTLSVVDDIYRYDVARAMCRSFESLMNESTKVEPLHPNLEIPKLAMHFTSLLLQSMYTNTN